MNNIIGLRKEMGATISELKKGTIAPRAASQVCNAAGKMIDTVKCQLKYHGMRKEKPNITFMKGR